MVSPCIVGVERRISPMDIGRTLLEFAPMISHAKSFQFLVFPDISLVFPDISSRRRLAACMSWFDSLSSVADMPCST